MAGLCRLCAETRPLEKMSEFDDPTLNIEQKLVDCCRWTHFKELNVDANLPQHICIVCIEKLERSWLFAESVSSAQYKLIEIINNGELGPFEDDTTSNCYYGENGNISTETPAEIDVYVEILENQQINTQNSEANPIAYQPNECIENGSRFEKSIHLSNVGNFLRLVKKDDRNDDGTINSDAIRRLGLVNWMVLQHQCLICHVCFCSNYELKSHFTSEHAKNDMRYMCSMCKSTDHRTYYRRSLLHKHIIRKHQPHLKYW